MSHLGPSGGGRFLQEAPHSGRHLFALGRTLVPRVLADEGKVVIQVAEGVLVLCVLAVVCPAARLDLVLLYAPEVQLL